MIFSANRPEYFPGFYFWAKMIRANSMLIADDLQFTSKSGLNRCAIKTGAGEKWLTIPLLSKGKAQQKICEVRINNAQNWRQKHWKSLLVNYKNAAYFEKYDLALERLFTKNWTFLIDFNLEIIQLLQKELAISCVLKLSSELACAEKGAALNRAWAKELGAGVYLAEEKMRMYLEKNSGKLQGVDLQFLKLQQKIYYQQFQGFIPSLSVIDLLFNEGDNARTIIEKMIIIA